MAVSKKKRVRLVKRIKPKKKRRHNIEPMSDLERVARMGRRLKKASFLRDVALRMEIFKQINDSVSREIPLNSRCQVPIEPKFRKALNGRVCTAFVAFLREKYPAGKYSIIFDATGFAIAEGDTV